MEISLLAETRRFRDVIDVPFAFLFFSVSFLDFLESNVTDSWTSGRLIIIASNEGSTADTRKKDGRPAGKIWEYFEKGPQDSDEDIDSTSITRRKTSQTDVENFPTSLDKEIQINKVLVKLFIARINIKVTRIIENEINLTIAFDGWINSSGQSIYDYCLITEEHMEYLWLSKDYSDIAHHTGEFLGEEVIKVMKNIGPEKLAAVVSDHAPDAHLCKHRFVVETIQKSTMWDCISSIARLELAFARVLSIHESEIKSRVKDILYDRSFFENCKTIASILHPLKVSKTQYIEGLLVYDKKDKIFYNFDKKTNEKFSTFASWIKFLKNKRVFSGERSALATIFFEPNFSSFNLASLLRAKQIPYWKNYNSTSIAEVTSLIKTLMTSNQKFFGIGIREIINEVGKSVKEINGITTGIAIKRTLSEINETIHYVSMAKICIGQKTKGFEQVVKLRGIHLKIANKNQIIHTLRAKLQKKIEDDEEKVSEELNQVAQKISKEVMENKINISSFNPIFQELIRIQSEKVNGVRYHPMFMQWAISIYSRAGRAAYEQHSGWQNKTTHLILEKMAVENIGSYGRIGFFSHDSFKIQKDFEDEKEELQSFIMQCEKKLQADDSRNIVEVNIDKNNYEQAKIIITNIDRSKFTVRLLDPCSSNDLQVDRSSLRPLMPTKLNWEINDYCEFKSPKDNKWHVAVITNFDPATQAFIITILSTKEEWSVTIESQNVYIRPFYDTQVHWMNYKTINPITEAQGQKNIREIMIDGKESKMRVDLAEHTLSKDVENAMKEFIHYSYLYWQIFHSKKPLEGLDDSRLHTLKNVHDWFGFLGMVKEIFTLYPNSTVEPRRISQDMLEGLFGTIRQLGGDSSTQTLKGYGHALNKFQVTAKMTSKIKSFNYGESNHNGMEIDHLTHDLFMGKIETPALSFSNKNEINQQNQKISFLQERQQLFILCLYNDDIASMLEKWKNDITEINSQKKSKLLDDCMGFSFGN
ncbi:hypothetical protein C1645_819673 [Glomus cerebriforme]|uniref:Uncharacterized protein n=1 Tax=Glomus cerebriforme TaxID=658196 RepID=A0A397T8J9_9GLOM|nr:hypothetical protein C1645_819673 [Glomus cerebriforme]